jgi:predicted TIM-barrel fold metal-dependent hydrolase
MIIDCHGHLQAPQVLYSFAQGLLNTRGMEGRPAVGISDEALEATTRANIELMDSVGTDLRFTSPRPYMMHSEKPPHIVEWWIQALNDTIARQAKAHPDRFAGVGALPQIAGESPKNCIEELERCVKELGFVGITLNPDPGEGDNQTPPMGDEYWYPLYEKLVELDCPALVHSASCRAHFRESYLEHFITEETIAVLSLCKSRVFQDFPNLKLVISHGGGSVPYQIGRWRSTRVRPNRTEGESFDDSLRHLYFDTCLYTQSAIDLLLQEVGVDRCMFGTEKPGVGSQQDPKTGEWFDDIKPKIGRISWLTDADRKALFEDNVRKVYTRFQPVARQT